MDISYNDLKFKEVVNLADGVKLGHIVDIIFDSENGKVLGMVVPGIKKIFKKAEDIFIPLEKVRKIGDDVILVRLEIADSMYSSFIDKKKNKKSVSVKYYSGDSSQDDASFVRFRKLDNKKYK